MIKNKKANSELIMGIMSIIAILVFIGLCLFAYYKHQEIKHTTYIEVIDDLSDADRCLYQCGFLYQGSTLLENYKFCAEKCDRIHERNCINEE